MFNSESLSADWTTRLRVSCLSNPLFNAVIMKDMCLCARELHNILAIFERLKTNDTLLFITIEHHLAERCLLKSAQVLSDQFIVESLITRLCWRDLNVKVPHVPDHKR